uniref:Gastric inhibitory polypeptide receptor n=1 Tax=Cyclopterus lumpus TaxID=8103 RepID=A0A8C2XNM7_CYCLU
YKEDCVRMIEREPLPQAGLFCNRTFDRYACWPDTNAGSVVNISCPFYLPWYDQEQPNDGMLYSYLKGLICGTCMSPDRKLHCTRNYIHDTMLERHWGREIMKQGDVSEMLSHQAAIGCRVAQVMMQYCVLANHYWFFGEAIYLYSVLIASVFINHNKYLPYICLGWGTPLLFVVPWVVMKQLKENKECWAVNENMNYWWIIRFPILLVSLINFLIFMKILKVILSKLRASNQSGYPDYKLRLAKATLTLIPLFGVHEIIFIFATDEQTTGVLRYVKVFFTLFLNSFQGFLVAVLYCYANKEVCCYISYSDFIVCILHRRY